MEILWRFVLHMHASVWIRVAWILRGTSKVTSTREGNASISMEMSWSILDPVPENFLFLRCEVPIVTSRFFFKIRVGLEYFTVDVVNYQRVDQPTNVSIPVLSILY